MLKKIFQRITNNFGLKILALILQVLENIMILSITAIPLHLRQAENDLIWNV